jgi:hypothetical protein
VWHRHFSANGSDVDDASFAAPAQMRKRLRDQMEGSPKMQVHRPLEVFASHVLERADLNNAGIVYYDVEAAETIDDLLDGGIDLFAFEQVARNREHFSAVPHEFLASSRQFIKIASEQCDPRAFSAKLASEDQSQSARSAGDQDDFAGK